MKKNTSFLEHQKEVDLFSAIQSCTDEPTISTNTIANILKKVYEKEDIEIFIKQLKK